MASDELDFTKDYASRKKSENKPKDIPMPGDELDFAAYYASRKNPDKHARHLRLAESQDLPVGVVERNSDEVEQRERLNEFDLASVKHLYPKLARYLSNRHNAAVSIDDIDPLKGIEDTLQDRTWLEAAKDVGIDAIGKGSILYVEGLLGASRLAAGGMASQLVDMSGLSLASQLSGNEFADNVKEGLTWHLSGRYLHDKLGVDPKRAKEILSEYQSKQLQAEYAEVAKAKDFFSTLGALTDNPAALTGTVAQAFLSMLSPAAATRGFAMHLLAQNGLKAGSKEAAEYLAKKEVMAKLASVSAIAEGAMAAGTSMEQSTQEGVPFKRAGLASLGTFATTAGISKLGSKFLPDVETQVATAGSKKQTLMEGLKDVAKGTVKEGVFEEMPQSGFEQIWSNIAQEKPLLEGVGAAMATGLVTGSAMGGGMSSASTTINALSRTADETMEKVLESVNDQQKIDSLVTYAQSSKTEERSPAQWKEYLHEVAGDKKVYLSAHAATSIPNLPSSIVDQINAIGTDIDIPIETFATEIIQDPMILEAMRPHLKMSEDGLTAAEIEEGNFTELRSLVDRAVKNQVELSEAQRIFEEVKDQLIATDRMSDSTARTAAKIIPAYVTTAAKRYGRSVADVYEKMGLRVVGPDFQIDDIKKTIFESDVKVFYQGDKYPYGEPSEKFKKDIDSLLERKSGEVQAGLFNIDVGPIDIVYGKPGNKDNDFSDGYGLSHIIEKHPEINLYTLEGIVLSARKTREKGNTVELETPDHRLVIKLDWNGKDKKWLLTAFEIDSAQTTGRIGGGGPNVSEPPSEKGAKPSKSIGESSKPIQPDDNSNEYNDLNRGSITFTGVESIIKLTERSNLATFLHEAGHLFLETEAKLSEAYGALEDQQALFQWLGVDSFDQVGKDHHEQFARGFEAYLREGKAPSVELRDVFAAFRQWLIRLYQSITSLDVEINDEIRQYMDRLLATEEEIERAMANPAYDQFFRSKEQAGMTDKQWEEYQKRQARAKNKATQTIDEKLLTELRKRRSKEWKEEKAPLIEEEKKRLSKEPVYQLMADLKQYPMEYGLTMEIMGWDRQPGKLIGKTKNGGVNPEEYAEVYGYRSVSEMVSEILDTESLGKAADAAAEERMIGKYGDIPNDGSLEEEVRQAVHNEEQAKLLLAEIKALSKKAGQNAIDRDYLKAQVKNLVSQMTREDLKPGKYYYAEIKAAKRAVTATDPQEQLEAKTQQIINHYLYREISEAKEKVERIRRRLRTIQKKKYDPKVVHKDYIHHLKLLVSAYDFSKTRDEEQEAVSKLKEVANWAKNQFDLEQGISVSLYDQNLIEILEADSKGMLDSVSLREWGEMTIEELYGIDAMAKHLRYVGGKMADAARGDFTLKANSAGDSIRENAIRGPKQDKGKLKKAAYEYGANVLLHADSVLRRLDGFKDGLMYRLVKRPIDDAITQKLMPAEEKAGEEMDEIYHRFYKDSEMRKMNKKEDFEGVSLSKWERISLVLNYGNESSREAVHDSTIDGVKPFTKVMMGKIIDSLDKNDMDFIQAVWDNIEQYKPALFGLEMKLNGVAPPSVDPMPLQTKHGVYKGGYYPLMYDRKASLRIQESEYNEMSKAMTAGRAGQAHTKDGMTKARVGSGGNPIRLDMIVWHQHVHDVLRRIHLTEAVNQAQSIIASSAVRNAAVETGNQELITALDVWIKDTAAGELMPVDIASRVLRGIRSGFSVSVIGLNFGTILMQPLGLLQTMPVIGYRNTLKGLVALSAHPIKVIKEVQSLSPFMHNRGKTFNKDIYDTLRTLHGDPNKPSFIPSAVRKSYFAGIVYVQRYVDAITWLGAYEAAKQNSDKQADLIHAADRAVARSQASGVWSDRTPIERGSLSPGLRQAEFVKLFTALGSYFFAKGNVAMELFGKTDFRNPAAIARYVTDMLLLFAVEAILVGLIRGTWPDGDDDESEAAYVAKEIGLSVLGAFPLFREIGSEIQGFRGGSTMASFYETAGNVITQIGQGELDAALVKSINKLGGIAFKYPASATNRAFDSLVKDIQGEDVAPIDYLMYREKD